MEAIKYLKYFFLFSMVFAGCSNFLDVSSESQVLEEDLYSNREGIHIAVNGVYRSLSSTELFGKNLTWGLLSTLGRNYVDNSQMPVELRAAAKYEWESAELESVTNSIWVKAYNTIANCNLIIKNTVDLDTSMFKYGSQEKNMILGEMYGIRALLHFEILRLFSSAPHLNISEEKIPYVTDFPTHQPISINSSDAMLRVVEDLEKAKELLRLVDTEFLAYLFNSVNSRIRNPQSLNIASEGDFFSFRSQRMNYYACVALLARVHLYNGNIDEAYDHASKIYSYKQEGLFNWTSGNNQGQINNIDMIYPKRPSELILSFSNNRNYDNWEATARNPQAMSMNSLEVLFADDLDDYRIVGWYNRYSEQRYLTWVRPKEQTVNANNTIAFQGPLIPIVRFSEMMHIMVEYYCKENRVEEALSILNEIRLNRGAKRNISSEISASGLLEVLYNDINRETLTEGQTFYFFKRLNKKLFNGNTSFEMNISDWTAPIPASENNYQF